MTDGDDFSVVDDHRPGTVPTVEEIIPIVRFPHRLGSGVSEPGRPGLVGAMDDDRLDLGR